MPHLLEQRIPGTLLRETEVSKRGTKAKHDGNEAEQQQLPWFKTQSRNPSVQRRTTDQRAEWKLLISQSLSLSLSLVPSCSLSLTLSLSHSCLSRGLRDDRASLCGTPRHNLPAQEWTCVSVCERERDREGCAVLCVVNLEPHLWSLSGKHSGYECMTHHHRSGVPQQNTASINCWLIQLFWIKAFCTCVCVCVCVYMFVCVCLCPSVDIFGA